MLGRGAPRRTAPPESVVKLTHGNPYNHPFSRYAAGRGTSAVRARQR